MPLRKADRHAERRSRTASDLVNAAQKVLADKGYHRTKVADIAHAAGVGVGTFYLYYPTKEAIFIELVNVAASQLRKKMDEPGAHDETPVEIFGRRMHVFFQFAADNRDLFRIVFGHDASLNEVVRQARQIFATNTAQNLRAGMDAGIIRAGDPDVWAQAIVGMCIQSISWWVDQEEVEVSQVASQIADLAQYGMLDRG